MAARVGLVAPMRSLGRVVVLALVRGGALAGEERAASEKIFQGEVLALANCSCVEKFGGGPLSRFYHLDSRAGRVHHAVAPKGGVDRAPSVPRT